MNAAKPALAALLLCLPGAALSQQVATQREQAAAAPWTVLNGAGIARALTGRVLAYSSATQDFRASGKTLYKSPHASWGNWAVRGDEYCSEWPPAGGWTCYRVDLSADGGAVRFRGSGADISTGRYVDGH